MFEKFQFFCHQQLLIKLPITVRQKGLNKNDLFSVSIRSIIQKLLKELDPGTVLCLLMSSVSSPQTVDGSTCFLLPSHMKLLPLRSVKATHFFFIILLFFPHHDCVFFQVPSREIDKAETRFWTHWNRETKQVLVLQHKQSGLLSKTRVVH